MAKNVFFIRLKVQPILKCFLSDECQENKCEFNGFVENEEQGEGRALQEPKADALLQPPEDGALMASYSVFVVEPGAPVGKAFCSQSDRSINTDFLEESLNYPPGFNY